MSELDLITETPSSTPKVNLLGLTREQLEQFFVEIGEKKFRSQQIMKWVHHFGVDNFDDMQNVGKGLKEKLKARAEIVAPTVTHFKESTDGTRKWVIQLDGKNSVETVFIPDGKRGTLCVPTQCGGA